MHNPIANYVSNCVLQNSFALICIAFCCKLGTDFALQCGRVTDAHFSLQSLSALHRDYY